MCCVVWGAVCIPRVQCSVCSVQTCGMGSVVCVLSGVLQKVCYLEMCEEYCRCLGVVSRVCGRTSWRFLSEDPATEQGPDEVLGENLR